MIRLFGGLREVNNFLKWLNYYGFKWFSELREAGVSRSRSYLAYVLERAVEIQRLGPVEKPSKRPTNTFLLQALDVVESFDGLGIAAVARGEVDSDMVSVFVDSFLTSEFYMFLSIAMFRLFGVDRCTSVLVPYAYKGVEAEVLKGFNERLVLHEPEYQLPGAAKALCGVEAECAVSMYLFHRSRAVLNDLKCLRSKVKRLGVAALPLEAPAPIVAISAAAGFLNFYKSAEMQQLLKHAGFKRGKVYLKKPYFVAVLQ
ncbi:MAG: hypothetical protein LM566_04135 [Pyrobaculum sp.]|nr:hypothetical protein [Pyrobaculum sp.]